MNRRHLLRSLPFVTIPAAACAAEPNDEPTIISSAEIGSKIVIRGALGLPLGTITKIGATFVNGDTLGTKGDAGRILIRVDSAGDRKLPELPMLYYQDETRALSAKGVRTRGLVGKAVTFYAYESGQFTGLPKDPEGYTPLRQGINFSFRTYLVITSATLPAKQK